MPDDNTHSTGKRAPLHVIPQFGREHEPFDACWCNPTKETRDPSTGREHAAALYIHKLEN